MCHIIMCLVNECTMWIQWLQQQEQWITCPSYILVTWTYMSFLYPSNVILTDDGTNYLVTYDGANLSPNSLQYLLHWCFSKTFLMGISDKFPVQNWYVPSSYSKYPAPWISRAISFTSDFSWVKWTNTSALSQTVPFSPLLFMYSAAQIYPNQNIRVICVSPIRVYAYAYTQIRVYSVCAYASLGCMS